MAEVTMSLEEYLDLIRDADTPLKAYRAEKKARPPYGKPKRKGKALPGMKTALRKANQMARKKNGDFKKGWNQSRVMKTAHRIRRRR